MIPSVIELWTHIYGEQPGLLSLFSGVRAKPGSKKLDDPHSAYFEWPGEREQARTWILREAAAGKETYHCAHLLATRRRVKENAAPMQALYVDGDGAKVRPSMPSPTAVVKTSPGREQFYWRLAEPVLPEGGEQLNRRLAYAMQADLSGWDLTQLLRTPGTPNFKYEGAPLVHLLKIKDECHDPAELDRLLPPLPQEVTIGRRTRLHRPEYLGPISDLSRLSSRMQELIRYGNRGEYESRSEADMAACVAMFGAGYGVDEVWAVMTDPANGISEKFIEKGRQGEQYLQLTISKAQAIAKFERHCICVRPPESDSGVRRKVVIRVG